MDFKCNIVKLIPMKYNYFLAIVAIIIAFSCAFLFILRNDQQITNKKTCQMIYIVYIDLNKYINTMKLKVFIKTIN